MATDDEIIKILAILAASYPHFNMTKETGSAYIQLLKDLPAGTLKTAAMKHATTNKFFPSVYELRQAVADLHRATKNIPNSYEAWVDVSQGRRSEMVSSVIEEDGQYIIEKVRRTWSHPFVEHVARTLGWPDTFPTDNPVADRAQFLKAYDALLSEEMTKSVELPEVTAYVDRNRQSQLEASNE